MLVYFNGAGNDDFHFVSVELTEENKAKLNDYSRAFADFIFQKHPEWISSAKIMIDKTNEASLTITLFSPASDLSLYLSTENNEITIGFTNLYHQHLDLSPDKFYESLLYLQEIMDEKWIFIQTENVFTSHFLWANFDLNSAINYHRRIFRKDQQYETKITSWLGTYNQTIKVDKDCYQFLYDRFAIQKRYESFVNLFKKGNRNT